MPYIPSVFFVCFVASLMRRVCVCLLRRLPLANYGQSKVVVTHPCTFDCRFRMAEWGRTVMAAEAMLGVFSGGVFG